MTLLTHVLQKHIRMALKERMVGNQKLGRAWDEESMRKFFKLEFMQCSKYYTMKCLQSPHLMFFFCTAGVMNKVSIVLPDCFVLWEGNIFLFLDSKADSEDEGVMLSHLSNSEEPRVRCLESGPKIEWLFGR